MLFQHSTFGSKQRLRYTTQGFLPMKKKYGLISTKNGSSLKNEKLIFCFENLAPHPKLMLLEMCMCAYILYKVWFDWYSKTNVEYLCDCTLGKKGSSKLTKKYKSFWFNDRKKQTCYVNILFMVF